MGMRRSEKIFEMTRYIPIDKDVLPAMFKPILNEKVWKACQINFDVSFIDPWYNQHLQTLELHPTMRTDRHFEIIIDMGIDPFS